LLKIGNEYLASFISFHFFEKACIIELNADAETGNLKFEIRAD